MSNNDGAQEIFDAFLEELFYEQYGADLQTAHPEEYERMFSDFRDQYGLQLPA